MSQTQSFLPNNGKAALGSTNRTGLVQNSSGQISLFDQTISPAKNAKGVRQNSLRNAKVFSHKPMTQTVKLQTARNLIPNKDLVPNPGDRVELNQLNSDRQLNSQQALLMGSAESLLTEQPSIQTLQLLNGRSTLRSRGERLKHNQSSNKNLQTSSKPTITIVPDIGSNRAQSVSQGTSKSHQMSRKKPRLMSAQNPRQIGIAAGAAPLQQIDAFKTMIAWQAWQENKSQYDVAMAISSELTQRRDYGLGLVNSNPDQNYHEIQNGRYQSNSQNNAAIYSPDHQINFVIEQGKIKQQATGDSGQILAVSPKAVNNNGVKPLTFSQRIFESLVEQKLMNEAFLQQSLKQQQPDQDLLAPPRKAHYSPTERRIRDSAEKLKLWRRKHKKLRSDLSGGDHDPTMVNIRLDRSESGSSSRARNLKSERIMTSQQNLTNYYQRSGRNAASSSYSAGSSLPSSGQRRSTQNLDPQSANEQMPRYLGRHRAPGSQEAHRRQSERQQQQPSSFIGSTINQFTINQCCHGQWCPIHNPMGIGVPGHLASPQHAHSHSQRRHQPQQSRNLISTKRLRKRPVQQPNNFESARRGAQSAKFRQLKLKQTARLQEIDSHQAQRNAPSHTAQLLTRVAAVEQEQSPTKRSLASSSQIVQSARSKRFQGGAVLNSRRENLNFKRAETQRADQEEIHALQYEPLNSERLDRTSAMANDVMPNRQQKILSSLALATQRLIQKDSKDRADTADANPQYIESQVANPKRRSPHQVPIIQLNKAQNQDQLQPPNSISFRANSGQQKQVGTLSSKLVEQLLPNASGAQQEQSNAAQPLKQSQTQPLSQSDNIATSNQNQMLKTVKTQLLGLANEYNLFKDQQIEHSFLKKFENLIHQAVTVQEESVGSGNRSVDSGSKCALESHQYEGQQSLKKRDSSHTVQALQPEKLSLPKPIKQQRQSSHNEQTRPNELEKVSKSSAHKLHSQETSQRLVGISSVGKAESEGTSSQEQRLDSEKELATSVPSRSSFVDRTPKAMLSARSGIKTSKDKASIRDSMQKRGSQKNTQGSRQALSNKDKLFVEEPSFKARKSLTQTTKKFERNAMALGKEAEIQVIVTDQDEEFDEEMALFVQMINNEALHPKKQLEDKSGTFRHQESDQDSYYERIYGRAGKDKQAYGPSDSSSSSNFKFDEEDSLQGSDWAQDKLIHDNEQGSSRYIQLNQYLQKLKLNQISRASQITTLCEFDQQRTSTLTLTIDSDDDDVVELLDNNQPDQELDNLLEDHIQEIKTEKESTIESPGIDEKTFNLYRCSRLVVFHIQEVLKGPPLGILTPKDIYAQIRSEIITKEHQNWHEQSLINKWYADKERIKHLMNMRQTQTNLISSTVQNVIPSFIEATARMVQRSFSKDEEEWAKESNSSSWSLGNQILKKSSSLKSKRILKSLSIDWSDAQFKLMDHMLLQPVIESKYLLRVREDAHVDLLQPAIMANVIQKMEAFDLVEYEFVNVSIINEDLKDFSIRINEQLQKDPQHSTIYEGKCDDFTFLRNDAQQVLLDKKEFLSKRLSVDQIVGRLIKQTLRDLANSSQVRKSGQVTYEDLEFIPAMLQPYFFQQLRLKAQDISFDEITNRLSNQQHNCKTDKSPSKRRSTLARFSRMHLPPALQKTRTMSEKQDFRTFTALESNTERKPYVIDLNSYQRMKSLVQTQSLNYYLLSQSRWQKSLAGRLLEPSLINILEQLQEQALMLALTAAFAEQQQRVKEIQQNQVLFAESSSSDEDDIFQYQRMRALLPEPQAAFPDILNETVDSHVNQHASQKVNSDLQTVQHTFMIFPRSVEEHYRKAAGQRNVQRLLIESFTMHTKLYKLPKFEPLMEIFIPERIMSLSAKFQRGSMFMRDNKSLLFIAKKNSALKSKTTIQHQLKFNPLTGLLQMTKQKQKISNGNGTPAAELALKNSPENQRRRFGAVTSLSKDKLEIDEQEHDNQSICTDDSLSQLSLQDVYDFYQMLNDYQSPTENKDNLVPQRRNSDQQKERFDILLQGFFTNTMHYCQQQDKDPGNSPGSPDDSNEEEVSERKPLPLHIKPITEQTVSNDHKIHDVLDQMVTKFKENQVKDFVIKLEVEAEDANLKEAQLQKTKVQMAKDSDHSSSLEDLKSQKIIQSQRKFSESSQQVEEGKLASDHAIHSNQENDPKSCSKVYPIVEEEEIKQNLPNLEKMINLRRASHRFAELPDNLKKGKEAKKRNLLAVNHVKSKKKDLQRQTMRRRSNSAPQVQIKHFDKHGQKQAGLRSYIDQLSASTYHRKLSNARAKKHDQLPGSNQKTKLQKTKQNTGNDQTFDMSKSKTLPITMINQPPMTKMIAIEDASDDSDHDFTSQGVTTTSESESESEGTESSKFDMEDHMSMSSEEDHRLNAQQLQKKRQTNDLTQTTEKIQERIGQGLTGGMKSVADTLAGQHQPIKKVTKRVRLLRQDFFQPYQISEDTKKVICLARKTTKSAKGILRLHKKQTKKAAGLKDKNEASKLGLDLKTKTSSQMVSQCPQNRILQQIEYDKLQLIRLICQGGSYEIIEEAIKKYPEPLDDPISSNGMTWLILAIKNGRSDAAKFLMSQRVDINKVDNDGNTAIHHAFMLNFESCIQLLIDSGAEENLKNGEGFQPWELHDAMRGDD